MFFRSGETSGTSFFVFFGALESLLVVSYWLWSQADPSCLPDCSLSGQPNKPFAFDL